MKVAKCWTLHPASCVLSHRDTQGIQEAEEFVKYALSKQCSRVYPCITPRFIPTCTMEMMKGAAVRRLVHCRRRVAEDLA